jgi:3-methyladenine DNA glycosylase AlkD
MNIFKDLQKLENKENAKNLQRFFKTGKGEYGEGDIFLGIKVPEQRKLAKKYADLDLKTLQDLLNSKIHEHRLTALIILTNQYKNNPENIFHFYLNNTKNINNWDLVDLSAPVIVGKHLLNKDKSILYKMANSNHLWEKRISIISTMEFIRNNQFNDTINISEILLKDKHDLIHKAVGWMLREVGKRNKQLLIDFLKKHTLPRTVLRYAIEKFPEKERKIYLNEL